MEAYRTHKVEPKLMLSSSAVEELWVSTIVYVELEACLLFVTTSGTTYYGRHPYFC